MVGFKLSNTLSEHGSVARGVCKVDDQGLLSSVTEMTKIFKTDTGAENREVEGAYIPLTGNEPVSMNFWGFTPDFFGHLRVAFVEFLQENGTSLTKECYVPKVVDDMIQANSADVRVLPTTSKWFGVTYPDDKPIVVGSIKSLVDAGEYPGPLWA
jgi:hypothetical protein